MTVDMLFNACNGVRPSFISPWKIHNNAAEIETMLRRSSSFGERKSATKRIRGWSKLLRGSKNNSSGEAGEASTIDRNPMESTRGGDEQREGVDNLAGLDDPAVREEVLKLYKLIKQAGETGQRGRLIEAYDGYDLGEDSHTNRPPSSLKVIQCRPMSSSPFSEDLSSLDSHAVEKGPMSGFPQLPSLLDFFGGATDYFRPRHEEEERLLPTHRLLSSSHGKKTKAVANTPFWELFNMFEDPRPERPRLDVQESADGDESSESESEPPTATTSRGPTERLVVKQNMNSVQDFFKGLGQNIGGAVEDSLVKMETVHLSSKDGKRRDDDSSNGNFAFHSNAKDGDEIFIKKWKAPPSTPRVASQGNLSTGQKSKGFGWTKLKMFLGKGHDDLKGRTIQVQQDDSRFPRRHAAPEAGVKTGTTNTTIVPEAKIPQEVIVNPFPESRIERSAELINKTTTETANGLTVRKASDLPAPAIDKPLNEKIKEIVSSHLVQPSFLNVLHPIPYNRKVKSFDERGCTRALLMAPEQAPLVLPSPKQVQSSTGNDSTKIIEKKVINTKASPKQLQSSTVNDLTRISEKKIINSEISPKQVQSSTGNDSTKIIEKQVINTKASPKQLQSSTVNDLTRISETKIVSTEISPKQVQSSTGNDSTKIIEKKIINNKDVEVEAVRSGSVHSRAVVTDPSLFAVDELTSASKESAPARSMLTKIRSMTRPLLKDSSAQTFKEDVVMPSVSSGSVFDSSVFEEGEPNPGGDTPVETIRNRPPVKDTLKQKARRVVEIFPVAADDSYESYLLGYLLAQLAAQQGVRSKENDDSPLTEAETQFLLEDLRPRGNLRRPHLEFESGKYVEIQLPNDGTKLEEIQRTLKTHKSPWLSRGYLTYILAEFGRSAQSVDRDALQRGYEERFAEHSKAADAVKSAAVGPTRPKKARSFATRKISPSNSSSRSGSVPTRSAATTESATADYTFETRTATETLEYTVENTVETSTEARGSRKRTVTFEKPNINKKTSISKQREKKNAQSSFLDYIVSCGCLTTSPRETDVREKISTIVAAVESSMAAMRDDNSEGSLAFGKVRSFEGPFPDTPTFSDVESWIDFLAGGESSDSDDESESNGDSHQHYAAGPGRARSERTSAKAVDSKRRRIPQKLPLSESSQKSGEKAQQRRRFRGRMRSYRR